MSAAIGKINQGRPGGMGAIAALVGMPNTIIFDAISM
jgi:hypothetical protein